MPWELTGNSGTDASTNFLGTIDQQPLVIKAGAAAHGGEILRVHPPDNNPSLIGYVSVGSGNAAALLTVTANWDGDGLALIGRPAASLNVGLKFREEGNPADPVAALGLASIPDAWMIGTHRQDVVLYASPGRVCLGSGPYPTHPQVAICNASNSPEHPDPRGGIWLTGGISFTSDLNAGTGEFIVSDRDGTQGNRIGLDFFTGYQPRLSITNSGNIGIGTQTPGATLDVAGDIKTGTGIQFPDGSIQTTANLKGDKGDRGPQGDRGPMGDKGDKGDPGKPGVAKSSAVCGGHTCFGICQNILLLEQAGPCSVTAETGGCHADFQGQVCCVCA